MSESSISRDVRTVMIQAAEGQLDSVTFDALHRLITGFLEDIHEIAHSVEGRPGQ